ncbi:hypothetical protein HHI36_011846 [Cryptolaemus montrouzieri]|uniref:Uncharacterized protein n=1 Tax=Cryptolaemus montrouzieri TaxID=559131 RepID=A0ABD2NCH2_9CUCU
MLAKPDKSKDKVLKTFKCHPKQEHADLDSTLKPDEKLLNVESRELLAHIKYFDIEKIKDEMAKDVESNDVTREEPNSTKDEKCDFCEYKNIENQLLKKINVGLNEKRNAIKGYVDYGKKLKK